MRKIIIDIGSRFTKVVVLNDNGDIIAVNSQTTEEVKGGFISQDIENKNISLLESVFECIRKAKQSIGLPIVDEVSDEVYVTNTLKHCYVVQKSESIDTEKLNKTNDNKICTWSDVFAIGTIETPTPIPNMGNKTIHKQTFIAMDPSSQNLLQQMFQYNNFVLKSISFGNCTPITSRSTIRVDIGYSGTRIYSKNEITIIEKGLEEMHKNISNICKISIRNAECLVQVIDDFSGNIHSQVIARETKKFVTELFTLILNKTDIHIRDSFEIIVSGGILHIPFIIDFIQEKFNINVMADNNEELKEYNVPSWDFVNCICVKNNIINKQNSLNSF